MATQMVECRGCDESFVPMGEKYCDLCAEEISLMRPQVVTFVANLCGSLFDDDSPGALTDSEYLDHWYRSECAGS